jgi:protein Mpv17
MIKGPCLFSWYKILDRIPFSQKRWPSVVQKMLVDQIIFAPFINCVFFIANGILDGKSKAQISTEIDSKYKHTLVSNWTLWPFVQIFTFGMIPLNYRILFVSSVGVGWNTYLSFVHNKRL